MPWSSKLSILAYMCSYFALASALLLSLINYLIIGWFRDELSSAYLTSWNVLMSLIVVFNILGQVALALLRYRTGERSLLGSLLENFKWSPLMTVFFGGVAFHISLALLAHLFHIDMQWGATSKEKKDSNFFQEIPFVVKTYRWMYISIIIVVGGMIYLGAFAPADWRIDDFTAIVPLSLNLVFHFLVPLVLNPSLMVSFSPNASRARQKQFTNISIRSSTTKYNSRHALGITHTLICNFLIDLYTLAASDFSFIIMNYIPCFYLRFSLCQGCDLGRLLD
jgi:hypothetical protein